MKREGEEGDLTRGGIRTEIENQAERDESMKREVA